jgi:hypothetical protein
VLIRFSRRGSTSASSSRTGPREVDAVFGELLAIPDAGEHQQLRAVDGAAAQHHLATRPHHSG